MKRFKKILISLLCAALLLGGCAPSPGAGEEEFPPGQAGESTDPSGSEAAPSVLPKELALPWYPELSLDPITCADGVQQTAAALLCEGLFELDETFTPQPLLCASYTQDPSGTAYTFLLRPGALFSDGTPLTAGDVADTLRRAQSSGRYGARLRDVSSITAGDGSVSVQLSSPNTAFPALLDRIVLRAADDADVMLFQFTSHETQLLTSDLTGSNPISVTGSIQFYEAASTVFQYVGINVRSSVLSNAAVRQALSLGLDRERAVSAFLSGHANAAQFPVSPVSADYPAGLEKTYSYAAFQRAMTSAGLGSGEHLPLDMIVNEESSFKVAAARHVAAQLSAFDLKISVRVLPWEEYSAALAAGNFDLYYGEVKLTADWDLRALLSTGGALNYGGFSDPTLDALLTSCRSSADPSAALSEVCLRLQEQAPILPVCFKTLSVLLQSGVVEHLTPTAANPFYNLAECTVNLRES